LDFTDVYQLITSTQLYEGSFALRPPTDLGFLQIPHWPWRYRFVVSFLTGRFGFLGHPCLIIFIFPSLGAMTGFSPASIYKSLIPSAQTRLFFLKIIWFLNNQL
jgi:hypothetical protein